MTSCNTATNTHRVDFTDETVVLVGEEEKRLVVHTNILARRRAYYRKLSKVVGGKVKRKQCV